MIPKRGPNAQRHIIDYGYFDNDRNSGHRDTILKPHIYSNELFEYCIKIINPLDKKSLMNSLYYS